MVTPVFDTLIAGQETAMARGANCTIITRITIMWESSSPGVGTVDRTGHITVTADCQSDQRRQLAHLRATTDGLGYCWGDNTDRQLRDDANSSGNTRVAVNRGQASIGSFAAATLPHIAIQAKVIGQP